MSVEEAIETLEKMIKCAELDQVDCVSRECVHCEYHTEPEEQLAVYKAALLALKGNKSPNLKKTVNDGIRETIYHLLSLEEGTYQFKSYLTGVLDLANAILDD